MIRPFVWVVILCCFGLGCKLKQSSKPSASPENRKILGAAAPYRALGNVDASLMENSTAYRRKVAWEIVERVLEPVTLANPELNRLQSLKYDPTLHTWQSWYDAQEIGEMFQQLYMEHGKENRLPRWSALSNSQPLQKKPFSNEALDGIFEKHAKKGLTAWSEDRFNQYLGQFTKRKDLDGLISGVTEKEGPRGRGITLFSPEFVRHIFENYREILECSKVLPTLSATEKLPGGLNSPCFSKNFPSSAVAIKTSWTRVSNTGKDLPSIDTSATGLAQTLKLGEWKHPSNAKLHSPSAMNIFTMKSRLGAQVTGQYRLNGMHITVNEKEDWLWISLWWADNPNEDFGSDRPASLKWKAGTVWENYKMCVVSSFNNKSKGDWKNLDSSHLGEVLSVTENNNSEMSWCSNPFIEVGKGNANTNCIGCHQHAGAQVDADATFQDGAAFPHNGRSKTRENFPGSFMWSFSTPPDNFFHRIKETVRSIDTADEFE